MPLLKRAAPFYERHRVFVLTCQVIDEEVHGVHFYRLIYHDSCASMNPQGTLPRTAFRRFILQFVIACTKTEKLVYSIRDVCVFHYDYPAIAINTVATPNWSSSEHNI